ncbi:MAG: FHA domain-containing protein [Armatimonadetes bacterium]|nr:FHA domain-containing protein [Armatimonadota bacterium]MBX3109451.1 FHA domain-containing protein [Fimbriimonadaceae bacterium]
MAEDEGTPAQPGAGEGQPAGEALEQLGTPATGPDAAAAKRAAREAKRAELEKKNEERRLANEQRRVNRAAENEKRRLEREARLGSHGSPETAEPQQPRRLINIETDIEVPTPKGPDISQEDIEAIKSQNNVDDLNERIGEVQSEADALTGAGGTKRPRIDRGPRVREEQPADQPPSPFKDIEDHLKVRAEHYDEYEPILELVNELSDHGKARLSSAVIGADAELVDAVFRGLCQLASVAPQLYWRHSGMQTCLIVQTAAENRTVVLDDDKRVFTIGRPSAGAASPDIPVKEPFISRQHAQLTNLAEPGMPPEWRLEDTSSQHGVKLGGSPLSGAADWGYEVPAVLGYRHVADAQGRAAVHPVLTLRKDTKIISPEFIGRLKRDCDLLFLVVNGDYPTKNDHNALQWVSEEKTKGVVIVAVTSGRLDAEQQAIVLDDLRHDARIVRGTKQIRTLVECRIDGVHAIEGELQGFLEQFRTNMREAVLDDRIRDARKSLLNRIGKVCDSLRPGVETEVNLLRRKLDETEHRLLGTVASVTEAKSIFESVSTNIERDLDRAVNQFGDLSIVASLASNTDQYIDQLELVTFGKSPVTIKLVPPGNPHATALETHRAIMDLVILPQAQQKFGAELYNRVFGDTAGSPMAHETQVGFRWLYQKFQGLLSGLPKFESSQIKLANYEDKILGVRGEINAALTDRYVTASVSTEERMENMFTYLLTKTRYSMTFFFSMFSIGALIFGASRSKLLAATRETIKQSVDKGAPGMGDYALVLIALIAIPLVLYYNFKAFKIKQRDVIHEESEKIRDNIKKHYQGIVKRVIADCEQVFDNHIDSVKRHTKSQLDGLSVARGLGGEDSLIKKDSELAQIRDEINLKVEELDAFNREREWVAKAMDNPTPSPLVPVDTPRKSFRPQVR